MSRIEPTPRPRIPWRRGSRLRPASSSSATSRRSRRWSSGSPPRRRSGRCEPRRRRSDPRRPDTSPSSRDRRRCRREDPPNAVTLRVIPGGRDASDLPGLLVVGAREIATLAGGPRLGSAQGDVARQLAADAGDPVDLAHPASGPSLRRAFPNPSPNDPAIAAWDGRIVGVAGRADLERLLVGEGYPLESFGVLDALGGTVTPGLVDPHTHLLFAGSREDELELRQRGATYLEILHAGGGILSTVAATRAATPEALAAHGRRWLDEMLGHGVTTVEAKSGYGLDLQTELRLLDVAYELGAEGPIEVAPTWLGAHAVPPELRGRPDATEAYVRELLEVQ